MLNKLSVLLKLLFWILTRKEIIVPTFGSYGDLLMTNGVLKLYAEQQNRKLYIVCKNDSLLYNLPFIKKHIAHSNAFYAAVRLSKWFRNIKVINYGPITEEPNEHLMQRIAKRLNFRLKMGFKPYYLIDPSTDVFPFDFKSELPIVCIQSEANALFSQNKNWLPERMDAVVEELNTKTITIQVGLKDDRKLNTHYHFNGTLSFRQSVYLLSKSSLFIGTEGALMHACSAIDTKAAIIFGGYIHPHQSGYNNIAGLKSDVSCAPCLLTTPCPYNLKCMHQIVVKDVMNQVSLLIK